MLACRDNCGPRSKCLDQACAYSNQTLLIRPHQHVGGNFLDDLVRGRLVKARSSDEPIEAGHHVFGHRTLMRGFRIVAHASSRTYRQVS